MKTDKLKELERRARALHAGEMLVEVTFQDGLRRVIDLPSVIPLLKADNENPVISIEGEPNEKSGLLLDICRDLLGGDA